MQSKSEYLQYYVIIGKFFKEQRAKTGYTIQDIADMLGKSKSWYGDAERGRNKMTVDDCMKLCDIYHTDLGAVDKYIKKALAETTRGNKK